MRHRNRRAALPRSKRPCAMQPSRLPLQNRDLDDRNPRVKSAATGGSFFVFATAERAVSESAARDAPLSIFATRNVTLERRADRVRKMQVVRDGRADIGKTFPPP